MMMMMMMMMCLLAAHGLNLPLSLLVALLVFIVVMNVEIILFNNADSSDISDDYNSVIVTIVIMLKIR